MCILALALGCHPRFPVVCAHNRDETRSRPSREERLEPETQLVCGRDLEAGGFVAGLHSALGHFAALTNCRVHYDREAPAHGAGKTSRGRLVEHLVTHGPEVFERFVDSKVLDGFHIVFGDIFGTEAPRMRYAWCCPEEDSQGNLVSWRTSVEDIEQGVFVISNENLAMHGLWPKCRWLQREVAGLMRRLSSDPDADAGAIQSGMADIMGRFNVPGLRAPSKLPKRFPEERERMLHTGPFAPWREDWPDFGTVSQRLVISEPSASLCHYFHRRTDGPPRGSSTHQELPAWEHLVITTSSFRKRGAAATEDSGTLDEAWGCGLPPPKKSKL